MWVKKLVHVNKIHFHTWNSGTLTRKSIKVVNMVKIMCPQEIKWIGSKVKKLDTSEFKLWYTRKVRAKNRVDIIVDKM